MVLAAMSASRVSCVRIVSVCSTVRQAKSHALVLALIPKVMAPTAETVGPPATVENFAPTAVVDALVDSPIAVETAETSPTSLATVGSAATFANLENDASIASVSPVVRWGRPIAAALVWIRNRMPTTAESVAPNVPEAKSVRRVFVPVPKVRPTVVESAET